MDAFVTGFLHPNANEISFIKHVLLNSIMFKEDTM